MGATNRAAGYSEAGAGCHLLLGVGQAMQQQTPASGQAIDQQLKRAETELRSAALHDGRWRSLSAVTTSFVDTLEQGRTPAQEQVVELTDGCQQFAGTSSSNSG